MLPNKKTLTFIFASFLFSYIAIGQSEVAILPVYNPSHVQLKVSANGKFLPNTMTISLEDKEIEIEAFSIGNDSGAELLIKDVAVDLVRNGRLINSKILDGSGDLSSLLSLAQANDIIRILVNGIYIKNALEKIELYSAGTINLLYSFVEERDLALE